MNTHKSRSANPYAPVALALSILACGTKDSYVLGSGEVAVAGADGGAAPVGTADARGPSSDGRGAASSPSADSIPSIAQTGPVAWETCGTLAHRTQASGPVRGVAVSRDGRFAAAVVATGKVGESDVHVWRLDTGALVRTLPPAYTRSIELGPDGSTIAVASDGVDVVRVADASRLWDVPPPGVLPARGLDPAVAFSPDATLVALAGAHGLVLRSSSDGAEVATMPGAAPAGAVAFSPDGSIVATSAAELWDVKKRVRLWQGPKIPSAGDALEVEASVAFSPDGRRIAISHCAYGQRLDEPCVGDTHVLRASDGTVERTIRSFARRPSFSPDGRALLSAGGVADLESDAGRTLPGTVAVSSFLPDGRILAGEPSGTVRILCSGTPDKATSPTTATPSASRPPLPAGIPVFEGWRCPAEGAPCATEGALSACCVNDAAAFFTCRKAAAGPRGWRAGVDEPILRATTWACSTR